MGSVVHSQGGVEIGEGTVIGAGSVMTRSLPPHSVAAGVPGRVPRARRQGGEESAPTLALAGERP